ncbi:MAG: 16S rRNA (cytidine(1402)-2'-O)-methyltransferase [Deltaproteobacteria bacterium]|nr:16S rRNA (cytidine(1402)-2'-O)-methyltransferase [Deltaproteobacteria bacterium]
MSLDTGTLYVVATPIGNMEDITFRALRILKEVSLIAAEDTRHTKKLLTHFGIATQLTSYFEHNEKEKAPQLIGKLKEGANIALVSDAGTPGISDPGYRLIKLAVENAIPVVAVPGPSALISILSVSGLPLDEFTFKGFLPSSSWQRKKFLLDFKGTEHTYVMYDSPRRIKETLEDILEVLGDVEVIIGRELTKLHEEVMRGKASSVLESVRDRELKGEIALIIRTEKEQKEEASLDKEIENLLRSGFKLNEVAKAIAQQFNIPKGEVYKEALRIKEALNL